jgi:hypothetical protein
MKRTFLGSKEGEKLKQDEAVRIPTLLAARHPRPVVEEATIEGIHMLVILGNEVDTVIRYNRSGGADMPQLSSYPEVAESAAHADERLAKQRDSGRANTTGEGFHWPRNWKLADAKATGKIWYTRSESDQERDYKTIDKTGWFIQQMRSGWFSRQEIVELATKEFPSTSVKTLDGTIGTYWSDSVNPKWGTYKAIQARGLKVVEDAGRRHIVEDADRPHIVEGGGAFTSPADRPHSVESSEAFTSSTDDKAFYRTLPFPIAIVDRKVSNAPNHTQRFSLLIELFEVVIRFLVLVQIADYLTRPRQMEIIDKFPEFSQLSKPALGTWVNLFRLLSQFQLEPRFLKEIRVLKLNEYQKFNDEFVNVRNQSFRGHGATLTESEYEQRFQEYAPSVYGLVTKMGFLANYRLVKTGSMEKNGDVYRVSVQVLMGDNPVFETQTLSSRVPMDTQKVLYLNSSLDALVLDPYIILEPCTECHRPELLLLDKFSDKKITYLGYESGHKPTYANVSRLPLALREVALKHS